MTEQKPKKSDRKTLLIFLGVIALSAVVGFFVGMGADKLADSEALANLWDRLLPALSWAVFAAYLIMNVVCLGLAWRHLRHARRAAQRWDGESEDIDQAESELSIPMLLTNAVMISNFFFFAAVFVLAEHNPFGKTGEIALYILDIAVFCVSMALVLVLQKKTLDLVKQLNPEKKGNILDARFQKDWLSSCDEAERQAIGEAAFAAMKTVSTVCLALWLISFLGCLFFKTGLLPVFCVVVIWLAQTLSYTLACRRREQGKA